MNSGRGELRENCSRSSVGWGILQSRMAQVHGVVFGVTEDLGKVVLCHSNTQTGVALSATFGCFFKVQELRRHAGSPLVAMGRSRPHENVSLLPQILPMSHRSLLRPGW